MVIMANICPEIRISEDLDLFQISGFAAETGVTRAQDPEDDGCQRVLGVVASRRLASLATPQISIRLGRLSRRATATSQRSLTEGGGQRGCY